MTMKHAENERDLAQLDDTKLIDERATLREQLECLPSHAKERATLTELYDELTDEFDRRARAAWANASKTDGRGR
jgi:hypothetical protein